MFLVREPYDLPKLSKMAHPLRVGKEYLFVGKNSNLLREFESFAKARHA